MAFEVLNLQRTEVREAEEAFGKGQKGSSAMPHKRNPVGSENICGCARVMRGYMAASCEDVALWHERDISHSSAERIILPDATELLDYMLNRFKGILENLVVYPGIMLDNIWRTRGVIFAHLGELCAFRAAIALLRERGMEQLIADTYRACKTDPLSANHVRNIYAPFTVGEINDKIVEMLRPDGMEAPVELVFQSIEGLHQACPGHPGDWYFTGRYPTPGGIRLCNAAFVDDVKEACPDICGNL